MHIKRIGFILCILLSISTISWKASAQGAPKVLVIRGGPGTGGFFGGGFDSQLSDLFDLNTFSGNTAWGNFGQLLMDLGFEPIQILEGDASNNTPIDLVNMNLNDYKLIIFASNNAPYPTEAVDNVENYIRQGGSALFISDANWGSNWGDAPSSDQYFLDRFGWTMNQDNGTYGLNPNDFLVPNHPILSGIGIFDGEGVSPITVQENVQIPGVETTILVRAKGQVRRNTTMDAGPLTNAASNDATLVVAQVDQGRIAGHFDRNTFFNANGVGTSLARLDNRQYAINLINWLTDTSTSTTSRIKPDSTWRLFPNPSKHQITIDGEEPIENMDVYFSNGKLFRTFKDVGNSIQVSDWPSGSYIIKINNSSLLKMIK